MLIWSVGLLFSWPKRSSFQQAWSWLIPVGLSFLVLPCCAGRNKISGVAVGVTEVARDNSQIQEASVNIDPAEAKVRSDPIRTKSDAAKELTDLRHDQQLREEIQFAKMVRDHDRQIVTKNSSGDGADLEQEMISIRVSTLPPGAEVFRGPERVGFTPLTMEVPKIVIPVDICVKMSGYMTLRTSLQREDGRSYTFELSPAKIR